ncbi:MAG: hypothetical protein JXR51_14010 [Bacteroidales bacterium]|nr:hypothetical protein [Bacteroidales bacterium]MBN2758283.1 hypothetical protein [Bacteroidales bacterium]
MSELEKHTNKNPFKVPENYFNDFSDKIKGKINEQDNNFGKTSFIVKIKPYIAIAAGFLLIYIFWFLIAGNKYELNETAENNTEITREDIFLDMVKTDELIDFIATNSETLSDKETISDENIDDILNNMDVSTIIETLN